MTFETLAVISLIAVLGPVLAWPQRWHVSVVVGELIAEVRRLVSLLPGQVPSPGGQVPSLGGQVPLLGGQFPPAVGGRHLVRSFHPLTTAPVII